VILGLLDENFSHDTGSKAAYRVAERYYAFLEAVRHARSRFPEFRSAFGHRRDGDLFTAKAMVTEGGISECIWLHVSSLQQDTIQGTLPITRSTYPLSVLAVPSP